MSPRFLRLSFSTAAAALILTVSAAGCAPKDEPPKITPKPQPSSSAAASDGGGDDTAAPASDGGGSEGSTNAAVDKSKLPPENRDLKAPDPKDYPGFYEKTDKGAEAAMQFFFDSYFYMAATGDSSAFESVIDESQCSVCARMRNGLAEEHSRRKFYTLPDFEVNSLEVRPDSAGKAVVIEYKRTGVKVYDGDKTPRALKDEDVRAAVVFKWQDGRWAAVDYASEVEK